MGAVCGISCVCCTNINYTRTASSNLQCVAREAGTAERTPLPSACFKKGRLIQY